MRKDSRIYVAGHTGLLGSSLYRVLERQGYRNLITASHAELDLTDASSVEAMFGRERPEYVFLAAAMVGGIHRNKTYPGEMIRTNLAIQTNVIHAAWRHGVNGLLFVGSACAYPRDCPMPLSPEAILTSSIEPTNEPFAVAKIAGISMCHSYNTQYHTRFVTVIPATMYGPNDNFDDNGHVVAALVQRFHQAKIADEPSVTVWGTGKPLREFIYVDDAADAIVFLMSLCCESGSNESLFDNACRAVINIGGGQDVSIAELAETIAKVVGFDGSIEFDVSRPDGAPRRLLDCSHISRMGWKPLTPLAEGLTSMYAWYLDHPQ